MAKVRFLATDLQGNHYDLEKIVSYQISMNSDAACHGVRLQYLMNDVQNELYTLSVYIDDERIFFGYIDTQRESSDDNGTLCFVYARSSACLLTDNEAVPYTYNNPSAQALFVANAKSLGFTCSLPSIYSNLEYQVSKGMSCFGAINDFVEAVSGKRIMVDADNCISLLQGSNIVILGSNDVISEKRIINRGDVVTRVDYKTSSDKGFDHHLMSRYFDNLGIVTSKKSNLSSMPSWQRDNALLAMLKSAARSYYSVEIVLDGIYRFELEDSVIYNSRAFGNMVDMTVDSVSYLLDKNGERTALTLVKNIDLEEISYVD